MQLTCQEMVFMGLKGYFCHTLVSKGSKNQAEGIETSNLCPSASPASKRHPLFIWCESVLNVPVRQESPQCDDINPVRSP